MKLVDDWRDAWRWLSVHCMVLAGAIIGAWTWLPDDLRAAMPQKYAAGVAIAVLVLGVAGRLLKQGDKADGA